MLKKLSSTLGLVSTPEPTSTSELPWKKFLLVAGGVVLLRLLLLPFLQINLGPDEAQYWWWSQHPDFGYYSKPPMIAWIIAATTIFTDAEWAVRLSSPILHGMTSLILFALTGRLYGATAAFWTGLAWLVMPAVSLSSAIISTDVPLLFFWSCALYSLVRLAESDGRNLDWAVRLGFSIGFGFMAKYAMIYFPLGMVLAFFISPFARKAFRPMGMAVTFAITLLIFFPNFIWNATHDFQTLAHTSDNANWGQDKFHLDELADFLLAQLGVAGPIIFLALLWGIITIVKRLKQAEGDADKDKLLLSFAIPALLIITVQAFISRAHANWAVSAYPAALILVTIWLLRARASLWLKSSFALHAVIAVIFLLFATNLSLMDALGRSNDIKRVRGWEQQAADIAEKTKDYPAIMVDDRELMGSLLYYMRSYHKPILAWDLNRHVDQHYEAFFAYDPVKYPEAALVAKYPRLFNQYIEFGKIEKIATSSIDLGASCPREYTIAAVGDYKAKPLSQLPPAIENPTRRDDGCKPY